MAVTVEGCGCPGSHQPCPTVSVSCPTDPVLPGTPVTFTAQSSGGDPGVTPTYNWTVSAGHNTAGQGTPFFMVDTEGADGLTVAATGDGGRFERNQIGRESG